MKRLNSNVSKITNVKLLCIYLCYTYTHPHKDIMVYATCFVLFAGIFIVFKVIQFSKYNFQKLCIIHYPLYLYCTQHSILLPYILKQIFAEKFIFTNSVSLLEKLFAIQSLLLQGINLVHYF